MKTVLLVALAGFLAGGAWAVWRPPGRSTGRLLFAGLLVALAALAVADAVATAR